MIRLFVALTLPEALKQRLSLLGGGVPGARWISPEQMHVTVRFIGEVDNAMAADIADALDQVRVPAFDLRLHGVGQFGDRKPHSLWAGIEKAEPLMRLHPKVDGALQRIGLKPEGRRYVPHITLARLKGSPREAVAEFLNRHALLTSEPFRVDQFTLFSSTLSSEGSRYRAEAVFPL
jgi:2'-5' RNA ligase